MEYLDLVDGLLSAGAAEFGPLFREAQETRLVSLRNPDGGFPGRRGPSDLYYTDFALRSLALLQTSPQTLEPTARFLAAAGPSQTLVECFNWINCRRILGQAGLEGLPPPPAEVPRVLAQQAAPGGGWAHPGTRQVSAYNTFLGALCLQVLGAALPPAEGLQKALLTLRHPSGGFTERPGEALPQASATAAALGGLALLERACPELTAPALAFLAGLQGPGGGFLGHPRAPVEDLLSTFTALLSLAVLGDLSGVDVPGVGRFVRSVALPQGGFRACPGDDRADAEYAYYGLGCLAILRALP